MVIIMIIITTAINGILIVITIIIIIIILYVHCKRQRKPTQLFTILRHIYTYVRSWENSTEKMRSEENDRKI